MREGITISPLELDYLKATGSMMRFSAENDRHRRIITKYLESIGLESKKGGEDWLYFENKEAGIKAFFSNFPMNNKKLPKTPSVSIEFTGHYFIRKNSYESARKLIIWFTKKFGTFFNITRVDIRQDIYGATNPFDYFPDFTNKENKLVWALRSQPDFNKYFENHTDESPTGFSLQTSRYKIMSYDRQINLEKKIKKGEISGDYYRHYKSIYKDESVQRLEIRLNQDACRVFTLLFFNGSMKKDELLRKVMANFAKNHALKEYDPRKPIHKMSVNNTFAELFFYAEKESLAEFKRVFEEKAGLKFSEGTFSAKGKTIGEISKMLGKKISMMANGNRNTAEKIKRDSIDLVEKFMETFKDHIDDKIDRFIKTLWFMDLDAYELTDANQKIYSDANLCFT